MTTRREFLKKSAQLTGGLSMMGIAGTQFTGCFSNEPLFKISLASLASITVTLPAVSTNFGSHTFTAFTENPNSNQDGDISNDIKTSDFEVNDENGQAIPVVEGFESNSFPPADWIIENPDASYTWERTTMASSSGNGSMFINHFQYPANGEVDEIILAPFDLTSFENPSLAFDVAYALYSASGFSDTLEVWASGDCEKSYDLLYKKYAEGLSTASISNVSFVPTSNEWRTEFVDLTTYKDEDYFLLKFRSISDYENNLYVDDINISGNAVSTVSDLSQHEMKIQLYPIPSADFVKLSITGGNSIHEAQVVDITGKIVFEKNWGELIGKSSFQLDVSNWQAGAYLISITDREKSVVRKIFVK